MGLLKDLVNNTVDNVKGLFYNVKGVVTGKEPDHLKLMAEYDSAMEDAAHTRSAYEQAWFTNISFLLGKQYVKWNDNGKKFEEPKIPSWRVQLVCNKILPRYRKAWNRLSTYDPVAVVTPNSNETLDVESAQLGTKVLRGLKDKVQMTKKNSRMNQWRLVCGTAFKHWFWNPALGSPLPNEGESEGRINQVNKDLANDTSAFEDVNQPPEEQESQKKSESGEEIRTGDVDCEVWNAFEVYPLDNPSDLDTCYKLMHCRYVPIEWLKSRYPAKADELQPESDSTTAGMYLNKIATIIANQNSGIPADKMDEKKILFKRVWERPSEKHPKGRFTAYANQVLLETGDTPNIELGKEFEMPVAKYDDLEVPGRFWAQATIEQMIPLNKEYNKSVSQIIESRNLMSKPKWVAVDGTVGENSITGEPGEVVKWNAAVPGAKEPHPITPPSLPQYVLALPDLIDRNIGDVGAMHEASLAQAPAGVTSGRALRELKQSDEDELNPLFIQDTENKKTIYTAFLKMVQANYTEERMVKVVGKDKITDVISFVGADLNSNNDVWVETTDIVPASRAGRQEMVMSFFKDGLLGDTSKDETKKRAIRLLEWGNIDDIWEDASLDSKQARYENKELAKGNPQKAESWDVHGAHILEHERPIKSPLFKRQPGNIQEITIKHMKDHQDWAMGINPENPAANINVPLPEGQMEQIPAQIGQE